MFAVFLHMFVICLYICVVFLYVFALFLCLFAVFLYVCHMFTYFAIFYIPPRTPQGQPTHLAQPMKFNPPTHPVPPRQPAQTQAIPAQQPNSVGLIQRVHPASQPSQPARAASSDSQPAERPSPPSQPVTSIIFPSSNSFLHLQLYVSLHTPFGLQPLLLQHTYQVYGQRVCHTEHFFTIFQSTLCKAPSPCLSLDRKSRYENSCT